MSQYQPRFIGDIKPNIDDPESEYVRIAQWLDKFLPKEEIKTYNVKLSDSSKATRESVDVIRNLIHEGKKDMVIRTLAEKITQYIPPKDYKREVSAIYNFVTHRLRYTKDIHHVETVHRARDLLRRHKKAADCDDFVILTGSLLQSIGHPVRLVIIGNNPHNKEDYSHIYLQTQVQGKWISLDGSVPGARAGWEAPTFSTKKIFNLDGSEASVDPRSMSSKSNQLIKWLIVVGVAFLLLKLRSSRGV